MRCGVGRVFNFEGLKENLKKPFYFVIIYMCFTVTAANLNMWETVSNLLDTILHTPLTIGSVTFTIAGILLFGIIVWIAHLLQKYVAYFFGEVDEDDPETQINKKQQSKLLVTRLIVLICGYLLAVAASGMPMDKLSIVVGALGVGVGLGLQNIVTNFVFGVILIFDRPIQIGDIIEVSSQSGRVKSMGLRSTKLNSASGAEVIIPNGNLLSQNITNWTYTDNLKLIEIKFSINGELDVQQINKTIINSVGDVKDVDNSRSAQIFYTELSSNSFKGIVKFWCSIYKTEEVLSEVRQILYSDFKNQSISLTI